MFPSKSGRSYCSFCCDPSGPGIEGEGITYQSALIGVGGSLWLSGEEDSMIEYDGLRT